MDMDMGRQGLSVVVAVLALIAAFLGLHQCRQSRSADQVYADWMNRSCAVGERGKLEGELRRYGSRLEARLEEAFLRGPSEAQKTQWRQVAQREWQEMVAAIDAGKTHGLTRQEISRLQTARLEGFSKGALDDYTEGYRSAAIAGLGIIGTQRAGQFLLRIRDDPQHRDHSDAARLALERTQRAAPPGPPKPAPQRRPEAGR